MGVQMNKAEKLLRVIGEEKVPLTPEVLKAGANVPAELGSGKNATLKYLNLEYRPAYIKSEDSGSGKVFICGIWAPHKRVWVETHSVGTEKAALDAGSALKDKMIDKEQEEMKKEFHAGLEILVNAGLVPDKVNFRGGIQFGTFAHGHLIEWGGMMGNRIGLAVFDNNYKLLKVYKTSFKANIEKAKASLGHHISGSDFVPLTWS